MILMTIDGVLRQAGHLSADETGVLLYQRLCSDKQRVGLLGSSDGPEKDEWFLNTEGLTQHCLYIPYRSEAHPTEHGRRIAQISKARASGRVALVVDPDPTVIATLHEDGIPALLYLHPRYTTPEFRPDFKSEAKPWDEMVKVIDYQAELKAKQKPLYEYEVNE